MQGHYKSWCQNPKMGIGLVLEDLAQAQNGWSTKLEGRRGTRVGDRQAQDWEGLEDCKVFSFSFMCNGGLWRVLNA